MSSALFNLVGMVSLKGVEDIGKHLTAMDKQVRKVQREMGKFGKSLEKTGKSLTKAFTVPLLGASVAMVKGVKDASDLSETVAKTGEIFGKSAAGIETWGRGAADALGQSKTQAMEAASNFAIFGKAAGVAGADLVSFSTGFVELASDLASFNNTSPEEAITAIGSALRGENEPMRRFGVLLVDATMRQEALKMGLIATTKEALTPQTKILAAQALIYKQTTTAQGDFARTSEGLANQQRILMAQVKNVSAELGGIFLPIATSVFGFLRENALPVVTGIVTWFKNLSEPMQNTILAWGVLLAAVGPVVMVIGQMIVAAKALIPMIKLLTFSQGALNAVMAANPIGLVTTAIVALIAAGILLYNHWDTLTAFLVKTWEGFVNIVTLGVSHIKEQFFNALASYLSLTEKMAMFIPVIGAKVTSLKDKFIELSEKERKAREERNKATEDTAKAEESLSQFDDTINKTTKDMGVMGEQESQLAKQRSKIEQEWSDKYIELTQSRAQALQREKAKALAEAQKVGAETDKIEAYYQELEKKRLQEIADTRVKFENDWSNKVAELSIDRIGRLHKERNEAIAKAEEIGAKTSDIKQFYATEEAKIEKAKQDKIKSFEMARAKEYHEHLRNKKEQDLQASMEITDNEKEWTRAHGELVAMRKKAIVYERDQALVEAERLGAGREEIDKTYTAKLNDLAKSSANKRIRFENKILQKKMRNWRSGLSTFKRTMNQIGDIVNDYYQTEIDIANNKLKKQKAAIKSSKMSEKDKAKAIQKLEQATYNKIRSIKKKQAKQDKKLAIFNVILASALAIMKVAASAPGFFIRIAAIAAITALGIAQIAIIKRKPIPSFSKGGGVKGGRGGVVGEIGEGKETELIFPLKTGVKMLLDTLSGKLRALNKGMPSLAPDTSMQAAGGNTVNMHIGTLIADDMGIKKLERSMRKYRIQENQRQGYEV